MEVTDKLRECASDQRNIAPFPASLEQSGVRVLCQRRDLLWQARDSEDWWGRIIDGAAATCALMTDGRRQSSNSCFRATSLLCSRCPSQTYVRKRSLSPTVYVRYPRERMEWAADTDPLVGRELREATLQTIARLQGQTIVLGRATAREKIAGFLLEMAARGRHIRTAASCCPCPDMTSPTISNGR